MAAVLRVSKDEKYLVVLCPIGHFIESHRLDGDFAGSAVQAEWSFRHPGDRFDRRAAACKGAGHPAK